MQQYNIQDQIDQLKNIKVNKFALCIFNCLAYSHKISRLLAVNIFLDFIPEYYTSKKFLKRVNLKNFQLYFSKIILQNGENKEITKSFIPFCSLTMVPTLIFNNYNY